MSLPDLVSLDEAKRKYAGLIPSKKWVEAQSRRGDWPRIYRTGPKSPGFFKRDELERFLATRLGLEVAE